MKKEYDTHTQSLLDSLHNNKTWGRPIEGGDNFHFQDNGATADFLYRNIDEVYKVIKLFVNTRWGVDVTEALAFNKHILDLWQETNTDVEFTKTWHSWFFDNKPLRDLKTVVSVKRKRYKDKNDHARHLFWYGRKSKRCFLESQEEIIYD